MDQQFIDIHTHSIETSPSILRISNIIPPSEALISSYCSVGLHPWYLQTESLSSDFELVVEYSKRNQVLAIGECGLDKLCTTSMKLQQETFIRHVHLANLCNKPLIIHHARSIQEIVSLLKQEKCTVPVIFHGFNKNSLVAKQLINNGYYLSFGKTLLNPKHQAVFKSCPDDKFFLETDNESDLSIEMIYNIASEVKGTTIATLKNKIMDNFNQIFRI